MQLKDTDNPTNIQTYLTFQISPSIEITLFSSFDNNLMNMKTASLEFYKIMQSHAFRIVFHLKTKVTENVSSLYLLS